MIFAHRNLFTECPKLGFYWCSKGGNQSGKSNVNSIKLKQNDWRPMIYIECNNFSKNRLCKYFAFRFADDIFQIILTLANVSFHCQPTTTTMTMMATTTTTTEISFQDFWKLWVCFFMVRLLACPLKMTQICAFINLSLPLAKKKKKLIWLPLCLHLSMRARMSEN